MGLGGEVWDGLGWGWEGWGGVGGVGWGGVGWTVQSAFFLVLIFRNTSTFVTRMCPAAPSSQTLFPGQTRWRIYIDGGW